MTNNYLWEVYIMYILGRFFTGRCFAAVRSGAALPRGAVNCIQLISTGIFTLAGGSLAAHSKLGPWANSRRRCVRFGTNPPAGETVPCVKAPFRPLATVPLSLTNSAMCKRSSSNGTLRQRSSKTAPLCKSGLKFPSMFKVNCTDYRSTVQT